MKKDKRIGRRAAIGQVERLDDRIALSGFGAAAGFGFSTMHAHPVAVHQVAVHQASVVHNVSTPSVHMGTSTPSHSLVSYAHTSFAQSHLAARANATVTTPLPSNVSTPLASLYGGNAAASGLFQTSGGSVVVNLQGSGNFGSFVSSLQQAGLTVQATAPAQGVVSGLLPLSSLPTVASLGQTVNVMPAYKPVMR